MKAPAAVFAVAAGEVAAVAFLTVVSAAVSSAVAPTPFVVPDEHDFKLVVLAPRPAPEGSPVHTSPVDAGRRAPAPVLRERTGVPGGQAKTAAGSPAVSPTAPRPTPRPRLYVVPRATPSASGVSGVATWYANGPGLYGAAGPALRAFLGPSWRGSRVTVCSGSVCVTVPITDWCACGLERVIDLSPAAFSVLAPQSAGVVRVTVSR